MTQGPNPNTASSTAGNAIASLLLGTGTQNNALIQNWKNVASQNFYFGRYMQDDWRVSERLTLNLGLRYDYETPRTERYNRMNYFDPDGALAARRARAAVPDLRGGLVFVGVDGNGRWQFEPDRNNISPRIGGAFQVERQDRAARRLRARLRAVVPAGERHGRAVRVPHREPLGVDASTASRRSGCCAIPIPAGSSPSPGAAEGLLTAVGSRLQAPLRDRSLTPWNRQWNVTIQRELPWQTAVEVAYVGTKGHDLPTNTESGLNLNQLDPEYWRSAPR